MGELLRRFLEGLGIPPPMHLFVVMGLANLVSLAIGWLIGRETRRQGQGGRSSAAGKGRNDYDRNDTHGRQVRELREQHEHFRNFMLNIPYVIKRLNATTSPEDLASSIGRLAGEVMKTDTVHLYVYQKDNECLKKLFAAGAGAAEVDECPLGVGIVGRAARDRLMRSVEQGEDYTGFGSDYATEGGGVTSDRDLTMAAPILFEGRLIGVLAVGRVSKPTGDERSLLKTVAEIAAVTLYNRAFLGEARKDATTDPLTGLHNRRYFFEKAKEYVESALTSGIPLSVFLFDIDSFKNYNDCNGHDEGDNLLREIGGVVQEESRQSTVVARYGGEEFICLLPGISKEGAFTYADRLRGRIASHLFPHREKQPMGIVSISGGVATFPEDGSSIQEIVRLADAALYRAKHKGRNRVEMHSTLLFPESGDGEGAVPPA